MKQNKHRPDPGGGRACEGCDVWDLAVVVGVAKSENDTPRGAL